MNRYTHPFGCSPPSSAAPPLSSDTNESVATNMSPLASSTRRFTSHQEDDAASALIGLCSRPPVFRPQLAMATATATTAAAPTNAGKEDTEDTAAQQQLQQTTTKTPEADAEKRNNNIMKSSKETHFPVILMSIVSDPSHSDFITWTPDGLSFVVLKPYDLATNVLPKYFNNGRVGKYSSFSRKLHRYGFRRAAATATSAVTSSSPLEDVFSHVQFLRDAPELCRNIRVVQHSKKSSGGVSTSHQHSSCSAVSARSKTVEVPAVAVTHSAPLLPAMVSPLEAGSRPSNKANARVHFAATATVRLLPSPPLVATPPPPRGSCRASATTLASTTMSSSPSTLLKTLERAGMQEPRAQLQQPNLMSSLSIHAEARAAVRRHFFARRQAESRRQLSSVEMTLSRLNSRQRSEVIRRYDPSSERVRDILRMALEVAAM